MSGTIGVVGHDPRHLKPLDEALRSEGFSTFLVTGGHDAYEVIKNSRPDLVMLHADAEGSGWRLVQELRLDLQTAQIPLLILRSEQDKDTESEAPALARHQHVEVMPAPFDAAVLVARIKALLADRPQ